MSRIVPSEEFDLIKQVISKHPEGIGISALEKALAHYWPNINRRTLQRRLKQLQKDKRIITKGESIALVYKYDSRVITAKETEPALTRGLEAEDYIPVSREGGIIRDLVRQPLMQRKPVGYQRSFLEEYKPGVTFYLSESLRSQFHEIGRTSAGKRPAGTYAREILNRLLVDLSWASSCLEGNTYSRLELKN